MLISKTPMLTALNFQNSKFLHFFFGILIGVVLSLAFYFIFLNSEHKNKSKLEVNTLSLQISDPVKNLATSSKTITLSGTTTVKSLVTINYPQKNFVIESNDGKFTTTIDLIEGKNQINVTAYDPQTGQAQTESREILYLDEDISNL